jgi:hypothetical protein
MYKYATLILGLLLFVSCGKKEKDINVDEEIETADFISAFSERSLPVQFTQQDVEQKEKDSLYIKPSVVSRFVPDSLFKKKLGSIQQAKFYRKGRYKAEDTKETYLFLVAEKQEKKQVYILCFDKEDQYSAGMLLVEKTNNPLVNMEGSIDKRLTIIRNTSKLTREGKSFYNKSAYVYNTEGLFTLILTESNEPVEEKEVFNPIDTLPRKDPLSRDYVQDNRNFVSVRDAGKKGKLLFFIHIEKQGGNCMGRLRGDMTEVKPRVYHYNKADDHCIIEFNFSGKSLLVKELEACGNHRGVKCSFNGRYSASK